MMLKKLNRLFIKVSRGSESYLGFIVSIILWFLILMWITPFLAQLLNTTFHTNFQINDFILYVTAAFLMATTYETRKMRLQTKESELRPIILRQGYITEWDRIKYKFNDKEVLDGTPLEFKIIKGTATDISGYIIIKKKKYQLIFGNEVSKVSNGAYYYVPKWGWGESGLILSAMYKEDTAQKTYSSNSICIYFKDIEGKEYCSMEYEDFSQESFAI